MVSNVAQAEREVIRQCHRGLEVTALQHEVLRALRRALTVDAAFFATADPETLLFTGAHADEPLGAATPLFLDNEYGGDDVNKFAVLATSASPVRSLDDATRRDRGSSERYRDIMGPLGLGDELRAALTVGGECWGYLCLHRTDHPLGFTGAEVAVLTRLGPHIAHGLRQAATLHARPAAADTRSPGVVLLADDLTVIATTPAAERLLASVEHDGSMRLPLPVPVHAVAAALTAVERGTAPAATVPSVRVRTTSGQWIELHASRLAGPAGEDRIAVVVGPAEPRATAPLLLAAHGLSPRESEVATMILRGASTRAISDALHISQHTVQDHVTAIFDKVGVRSRRELVGLLLGRH